MFEATGRINQHIVYTHTDAIYDRYRLDSTTTEVILKEGMLYQASGDVVGIRTLYHYIVDLLSLSVSVDLRTIGIVDPTYSVLTEIERRVFRFEHTGDGLLKFCHSSRRSDLMNSHFFAMSCITGFDYRRYPVVDEVRLPYILDARLSGYELKMICCSTLDMYWKPSVDYIEPNSVDYRRLDALGYRMRGNMRAPVIEIVDDQLKVLSGRYRLARIRDHQILSNAVAMDRKSAANAMRLGII